MKRIFTGLFFVFFALSCSINKKPEFIKIDNLKLVSFKNDTITLTAAALFNNPNDVGGKIATDAIQILINEEEVARVSSEEFKVPAKKEFSVPLQVAVPTKKLFKKSNSGFLNGLLRSVLGNTLKVHFKGEIKYKVFGFSSTYPIDKIEEFKIRL